MTTPIKQKTRNTPFDSTKKPKPAAVMNQFNVENMTPSRLNRICLPKPSDGIEQNEGGAEGIQVAIRMRPLNSKEHTHKKVWKVLSKYASVAQTTLEGKPLPDRKDGRNFFSYDQTFDESSTTYQVYSAIAQPIVTTACTGRNGTIFAYGQTSSGKTYTMQGSGTIAEGISDDVQNGDGGIVHMTAHDIFAHIASCPDRIFVVRASFLEIYNEEVRDLLQDYSNTNKVLQIREDPRRGVFVQSKELIATDSSSLLAVLWQGEKSRSFATTAMNERSSRSHTLFRITIESRSRMDDNDDDENEDATGAVRVSTLNLVDLAGSESVRHTGATGDRQKEGGMINQSLLTLSRVIVALGTPNSSHVNFRDSKLTRILQPSLSGNARMAVVCCATPSELYLEETRSTLLFASRAKLVKTNAQINEVLDDRSIIRRLQRDLALARSQQSSGGNHIAANVAEWETLATLAGKDAKLAKDKLKRLFTTILMTNEIDDTNLNLLLGSILPNEKCVEIGQDVTQPLNKGLRRRLSDGNLHQFMTSNIIETPLQVHRQKKPSTDPQRSKFASAENHVFNTLSSSDELTMMKQAVAAKESKVSIVKRQMDQVLKQLQGKDLDLVAANCSNDLLRSDRDDQSSLCSKMSIEIEELKQQRSLVKTAHDALLLSKDSEIVKLQSQLEHQLADRRDLEETVDSLQESKASSEKELAKAVAEKDSTIATLRDDLHVYKEKFDHQANVVIVELRNSLAQMEKENLNLTEVLESTTESLRLAEKTVCVVSKTVDELQTKRSEYLEESKDVTAKYTIAVSEVKTVNESLRLANLDIECQSVTILGLQSAHQHIEMEKLSLNLKIDELAIDVAVAKEEIERVTNLQKEKEDSFIVLKNDYNAVQLEKSRLIDMLEVAGIKIAGMVFVLKNSESEMEAMSMQLSSAKTLREETDTILLQRQVSIAELDAQLSATIADRKNDQLQYAILAEALHSANEQCNEYCTLSENTKEELTLMVNSNRMLDEANADLERSLIDTANKFSNLQQSLHDARHAESTMKHNFAESFVDVNNKFDVITIMLHRSELDKKFLADENMRLNNLNAVKSATIDSLNAQVVSNEKLLNDRLKEMTSHRGESNKLTVATTKRLRGAETVIEGLSVVLNQSQIQLGLAISDCEVTQVKLATSQFSLQKSCEEVEQLTQVAETLTSEVHKHLATIRSISTERDAAVVSASELYARVNILEASAQQQNDEAVRHHQEVVELESKCKLYERALDASQQLAEQILVSYEMIKSEHIMFISPFEATDENDVGCAKSWSSGTHILPTLQLARLRLDHLSQAVSSFATKFSEQSIAYNNSQEELRQAKISTSTANNLLRGFKEKVQQLEQAQLSQESKFLRSVEIWNEEKKFIIADLQQSTIEIDGLKIAVTEVTAEKERFEARLVSIRSIDLNAEVVECENKELKILLANANNSINEARMATKEITTHLNEKSIAVDLMRRQLDSKENEILLLSERYAEDQQRPDVKKLTAETHHLKNLLKEEMDHRDQFEKELERRMSDEQRILICEAEEAMHGLRCELESKINALKRSEAEAYAAREMKDDLDDQCRRTQDHAIQLESQISDMENENNRLRRLSNRQEAERESEVVALKEGLSLANTERQENHSLIRDLKQKLNTLQGELEDVCRDLLETRKQLEIGSFQNFEERNNQLTYEVQQLKKEIEVLQRLSEDNTSSNNKHMELERDNERLRQKLKSYVDRCEKLESSKLTKDKLEAIKKLMADKLAVEKELKNARQEIELVKLASGAHLSNTMEDAELTKIRFDNEAMENQLRKYASQCQHFEDEKMRIRQTFKSAKVEVLHDDIEKAAVALCDKVASLEEECDSLAKYKNKAMSHQVELTAVKKQNEELLSKVENLQRKIDKLQWVEAESKNFISSLTQGTEKLQHDVDRSRLEAHTMRNQLKYLEQENLQLLIDFKAAKQKIHGLKAELNLLHSQRSMATIESVKDIVHVSAKKPPKTPNDKENVQRCDDHNSEKKKIPRTATSSTTTRPSSTIRRSKPVTARLGDAFSASDENTQECKQS